MSDLVEDLAAKVAWIAEDEASIGVLSTGETIAVALILDRKDLLPPAYSKMLEAVERLGPEWFAAALRVQRDGWKARKP